MSIVALATDVSLAATRVAANDTPLIELDKAIVGTPASHIRSSAFGKSKSGLNGCYWRKAEFRLPTT
jgi:hypothetical protein